jgi:alpha-glucosidase
VNFSKPEVQQWYVDHQTHYLNEGVDFWWDDEGETDYYTYHHWNQAHNATLAAHDGTKRPFTINRAFTAGLQTLGE